MLASDPLAGYDVLKEKLSTLRLVSQNNGH